MYFICLPFLYYLNFTEFFPVKMASLPPIVIINIVVFKKNIVKRIYTLAGPSNGKKQGIPTGAP